MAFCSNCGTEVQGRFCPKCGTPAGTSSGSSASSAFGASPVNSPPPAISATSAGLQENVAAALCYLLGVLTGILFLVLEPYNRNPLIRFHAFQAIFAWIAAIVIGIVLNLLAFAITALPFIGWLIDILVWLAFSLGCVGLWLYLMYKAYNKERVVLPVIGALAEKQARSV
jgi:uncharacterized membrane protein